jgi:sugar transferase (PEP-CTERM system associated)
VVILTAAIIAGFYFQDLYGDIRVRSRILLVQQMCLSLGIAFLLQALLNYVDSTLVFPRWVMLLGSCFVLIAVPVLRILFSAVITSTFHAERVLFVGCSDLALRLVRRFRERPELGMTSIGFVGEPDAREAGGERCVGPVSDLREIVGRESPDRIVVALEERRGKLPYGDLMDLRFSGIQIEEAASTYETSFDRVCVERLRPAQLIFSSELGPRRSTLLLQSLYSTVIALFGVVATLPIAIVAAVLIKLTSRGPILYRQKRLGLMGAPFYVHKFRSMYDDAEARTGAVWAQKNDPRITPVGRWLRRFRIDEIPQLFNVLRGEMALVGPRPERPEFVEALEEQIPFYRQRLAVKPGITGWAQIQYKYGDTFEDTITKLEYDLYYIKNFQISIDLYILFHTLKVILLGKGAQSGLSKLAVEE